MILLIIAVLPDGSLCICHYPLHFITFLLFLLKMLGPDRLLRISFNYTSVYLQFHVNMTAVKKAYCHACGKIFGNCLEIVSINV